MPTFNLSIVPFILLSIAVLSLAQTGPQAALIPACVKNCDPAAIASVNCTNEDQYCHCVRQQGILSNISACANAECESPSRDIYVFTTLFGEVCHKFNISVPVLGSNSSGKGTNVTVVAPAQPSIGSSTGSAERAYGGGYLSWMVSGVLCIVALAVWV